MKKDNIRDYATIAFRYYAEVGRPTEQKIKRDLLKNIVDEEIKIKAFSDIKCNRFWNPVESSFLKQDAILEECKAEILDLLAVQAVVDGLQRFDDEIKITLLEEVYFFQPNKPIAKGDISARVTKCSLKLAISERVAYRELKKIREMFAKKRGLRIC